MKTTIRDPNRKPPHPGEYVKFDCLEPLGLTVTAAAKHLGVTRQALSEVVNERTGVSALMALRLSMAFGSTPDLWLRLQMAHDLWVAQQQAKDIRIERIQAAA
jgi:addiction module HigA family antidote